MRPARTRSAAASSARPPAPRRPHRGRHPPATPRRDRSGRRPATRATRRRATPHSAMPRPSRSAVAANSARTRRRPNRIRETRRQKLRCRAVQRYARFGKQCEARQVAVQEVPEAHAPEGERPERGIRTPMPPLPGEKPDRLGEVGLRNVRVVPKHLPVRTVLDRIARDGRRVALHVPAERAVAVIDEAWLHGGRS